MMSGISTPLVNNNDFDKIIKFSRDLNPRNSNILRRTEQQAFVSADDFFMQFNSDPQQQQTVFNKYVEQMITRINNSNLPAEQKTRLINKLFADPHLKDVNRYMNLSIASAIIFLYLCTYFVYRYSQNDHNDPEYQNSHASSTDKTSIMLTSSGWVLALISLLYNTQKAQRPIHSDIRKLNAWAHDVAAEIDIINGDAVDHKTIFSKLATKIDTMLPNLLFLENGATLVKNDKARQNLSMIISLMSQTLAGYSAPTSEYVAINLFLDISTGRNTFDNTVKDFIDLLQNHIHDSQLITNKEKFKLLQLIENHPTKRQASTMRNIFLYLLGPAVWVTGAGMIKSYSEEKQRKDVGSISNALTPSETEAAIGLIVSLALGCGALYAELGNQTELDTNVKAFNAWLAEFASALQEVEATQNSRARLAL